MALATDPHFLRLQSTYNYTLNTKTARRPPQEDCDWTVPTNWIITDKRNTPYVYNALVYQKALCNQSALVPVISAAELASPQAAKDPNMQNPNDHSVDTSGNDPYAGTDYYTGIQGVYDTNRATGSTTKASAAQCNWASAALTNTANLGPSNAYRNNLQNIYNNVCPPAADSPPSDSSFGTTAIILIGGVATLGIILWLTSK
jgi:hypothetical protein